MPAILLLKASPWRFVADQIASRRTPSLSVTDFIASGCDDAGQVEDLWVFAHRWASVQFDPLAFARAKVFLNQLTRLVARAGYQAEPLNALSPDINLPSLAMQAGLGDSSPYGLLVHPAFGPRLILTALRTDYPLSLRPRWSGRGCTDCALCVRDCPQDPTTQGVIDLGQCQRCTRCLTVCPVGWESAQAARDVRSRLG
ncbi:hypothetical protein CCR91_11140 [Thiorhodovibrio winogradskyi]|nr:hypothetical protein [Thiorhodovibrio winogradskyi]